MVGDVSNFTTLEGDEGAHSKTKLTHNYVHERSGNKKFEALRSCNGQQFPGGNRKYEKY